MKQIKDTNNSKELAISKKMLGCVHTISFILQKFRLSNKHLGITALNDYFQDFVDGAASKLYICTFIRVISKCLYL